MTADEHDNQRPKPAGKAWRVLWSHDPAHAQPPSGVSTNKVTNKCHKTDRHWQGQRMLPTAIRHHLRLLAHSVDRVERNESCLISLETLEWDNLQ
jgi:hypothetical protein